MELVPPLSKDTKWTWRATEDEGESGTREDQLRLLYLQSTMSSIQNTITGVHINHAISRNKKRFPFGHLHKKMTSYPTFCIVHTDGKKLGEITVYKRKQLSLISNKSVSPLVRWYQAT